MYVPCMWSMYLLLLMCVAGVCYVYLVCGTYDRYGERRIACVHLVYDVCCVLTANESTAAGVKEVVEAEQQLLTCCWWCVYFCAEQLAGLASPQADPSTTHSLATLSFLLYLSYAS